MSPCPGQGRGEGRAGCSLHPPGRSIAHRAWACTHSATSLLTPRPRRLPAADHHRTVGPGAASGTGGAGADQLPRGHPRALQVLLAAPAPLPRHRVARSLLAPVAGPGHALGGDAGAPLSPISLPCPQGSPHTQRGSRDKPRESSAPLPSAPPLLSWPRLGRKGRRAGPAPRTHARTLGDLCMPLVPALHAHPPPRRSRLHHSPARWGWEGQARSWGWGWHFKLTRGPPLPPCRHTPLPLSCPPISGRAQGD